MKYHMFSIFLSLSLLAPAARALHREPTPEAAAWLQEVEAYKQSISNLDPYEKEALALNQEASYGDRFEAIQSLAEDPAAHIHALEQLLNDPHFSLRYAAIEIVESIRPDIAYQSLLPLFDQLVLPNDQRKPTDSLRVMRVAALMARMGDGSKFPYVTDQLIQSSRRMDLDSAIWALSSYFYMKELEPHRHLVAFVDKTMPELSVGPVETRGQVHRLIRYAISTLGGLHAVEAIPDFERWQADPRFEPVRDTVEFNLRRLRDMQAALDRGEPDPRDAVKITPGTAPAWKLPKAVRD